MRESQAVRELICDLQAYPPWPGKKPLRSGWRPEGAFGGLGCEPGGAHSVSPSLLLRPHAPAFPRLLAFSEEGAVSCGWLVDGVLVEG